MKLKVFKNVVLCLLMVALSACATNTKNRWLIMGVAAPVGGIAGYATAPEGEKESSHALLWASVFSLGAAVFGNYYFNDDKELNALKLKSFESEEQLSLMKKKPKFRVISKGKGYFEDPLNPKSKKKVFFRIEKPVDKKGYEWIPDGDGRFYRSDMRIERIEDKESNE